MSDILIFTDGGSRGNPGPAAIGVSVSTVDGQTRIYEHGHCLGTGTNNEAEYEAFLHSAQWLSDYLNKNQVDSVKWQLDSKLVVEQLKKNWKIKEERLRLKAQQIWDLLAKLSVPYSIGYVPRAMNHEADSLVNSALDGMEVNLNFEPPKL